MYNTVIYHQPFVVHSFVKGLLALLAVCQYRR